MWFLLENHCQNISFRLFFQNKSIFWFEMISHIKFSANWLLVFFQMRKESTREVIFAEDLPV